jgi:molecular chaperone DnaK (HSP70)
LSGVSGVAPLHIGVDFGTTNTVVALGDASGNVRALQFPSAEGLHGVLRPGGDRRVLSL